MFSSKRTRIVACLTLVTTFAYYHFNGNSQEVIQLQLDQNINHDDIAQYGKELENVELHQNTNVTETRLMETPVNKEQLPVEKSNNVKSPPPITKRIIDETNMIIVNNKIYHKNDTIPSKPVKFPILQPSMGKIYNELDFKKFKDKDRKFLKKRKQVMIKRAKQVAFECNHRSKLIQARDLHLVWDTQHSPPVLFCPLYKVASTTMIINFLRLAHFNEDNPELKKYKPKRREQLRFKHKWGAKQNKVYDLFPPPTDKDEWMETYKNSLRVIVVRHPFSRILSAYRDKMTKMNPRPPELHYRDLQLRIIAKYRPVESEITSQFPTFKEFIQYLLDSTKNYITAQDWNLELCWMPYWAKCNVCGADFNLIMKLETMAEDERFLYTLTDMEELKELKSQEWRHMNNSTSTDLIPQYYSQLTKLQIRQLHQRYFLDFKLFGYKIDDVIDFKKDNEDSDEEDETD